MIRNISILNLFCLLLITSLAFSCSKDESIGKSQIDGTFKCFEGELDGEVFDLPFDGFSLEIKIRNVKDEDVLVEVHPYGNGKPIDFPDQLCTVRTDSDGFLNLISKKDGSMYVIFYDKETIDCYPGNGTRISGSRTGKKPNWWDD